MTAVHSKFIHEALLYGDLDEFLAGCTRFLRQGFDADEPAMVAVPEPRLSALRPDRDPLGSPAGRRCACACGAPSPRSASLSRFDL